MKKGSFVKRTVQSIVNKILFILDCIWFILKWIFLLSLIPLGFWLAFAGKIHNDIRMPVGVFLVMIGGMIIMPVGFYIIDGNVRFPVSSHTYFCFHDYNGCKCRICGKIRDEGHDLDGCCTCRICGNKKHDLNVFCTCRRCGSVIHDWEEQSRSICTDAEEDGYGGWIGRYTEETITYRCRRCGEERTEVNKVEYE